MGRCARRQARARGRGRFDRGPPNGILIAAKKGARPGPRVMISAHMDEVGYIVKAVSPEGFLFFDKIGGATEGCLPGRRVLVKGEKGGCARHRRSARGPPADPGGDGETPDGAPVLRRHLRLLPRGGHGAGHPHRGADRPRQPLHRDARPRLPLYPRGRLPRPLRHPLWRRC